MLFCLCVCVASPPLSWAGVQCPRLRLWPCLPTAPNPILGTSGRPAGEAQWLRGEQGCCREVGCGPGPRGTSARGAAMRSKPSPRGDSLLLWREKRGCQPLGFSPVEASSLLLHQRRPSPEAGKVWGWGEQMLKMQLQLLLWAIPLLPRPQFSVPLKGRLYPLCTSGSRGRERR